MKDIRQRAFVGLIGLVSAGLLSMGCSSSGGSGTGGTSGSTGGSTGTGGTSSGSGGSSATGGTGGGAGAAGPACKGGVTTPPAADLITDFSDAVQADGGTSITFGTSTTVQGGIATFQNPASTPGTAKLVGGALNYMATVSAAGTGGDAYPYSGFAVYINGPACVDASQYTGVQFSISGDVGTCSLVFSFNDAEHGVETTSTTGETRATGPSGSYSPQKAITVTSTAATVMVKFGDPTGGSPSTPVDPMNLTAVQFQLGNSSTSTAPCTGSITVDDIKFYK
jgi:hypothetical protein